MQNAAIELLLKNRQRLIDEKAKMLFKFKKELSEVNTAIEQLSGKTVWETASDFAYDDENPNYIKASEEEI